MKLADYERRVLRAYRDEDLSGLIPGAALNTATEHLSKLGLIDWNGITEAGRELLEPKALREEYDKTARCAVEHVSDEMQRLLDDGCPHA